MTSTISPGRAEDLQRASEVAARRKREHSAPIYRAALEFIRGLDRQAMSLRRLAAALNAAGHTTARGKPWNAVQVSRLLASY